MLFPFIALNDGINVMGIMGGISGDFVKVGVGPRVAVNLLRQGTCPCRVTARIDRRCAAGKPQAQHLGQPVLNILPAAP
jgi:hypothetical protein